MSEENPIQQLALEVASLRRAIIDMARVKGERLTRAQVLERLGCHRNTLKAKMEAGFPAPGADGKWLFSDVLEWESTR